MRVFDVNLRAPFYSQGVLRDSLRKATVLKLNDIEMPLVLNLLDVPGETEPKAAAPDPQALLRGARRILAEFPPMLVCVTMGQYGSLLVTREAHDYHRGVPIKVADTIGAGDAFTAALTSYYLQGAPLRVLNEAGNRWGSWVASQSGGMPPLSEAQRIEIEETIAAVRG